MNKQGIGFPNAMFRNMTQLYQINWGSATVLQDQRSHIPTFREHYPDAIILVRGYVGNWYEREPIAWAQECASFMRELQQYGAELTWANEQNLRAEGHPDGAGSGNGDYPPRNLYEDIRDWNAAVIKELRKEIPWCVLHFPALSNGHSDDQEDANSGYCGLEILKPVIDLCDKVDVHTYWESEIDYASWDHPFYGRRYQLTHGWFPTMTMHISEFSPHLPSYPHAAEQIKLWLDSLPSYVEGADQFIWDSDEANRDWIIQNQPMMVNALRAYQSTPQEPPIIVHPNPTGGTVPDYVVSLGKNPEGNQWPQFMVQRYTGTEEYYKLVDWSHEDNTGWSGLIVVTLDENGKNRPGVGMQHFWPQPRVNQNYDGFEPAVSEMKDLDGDGIPEVACVQYIVNPRDSGFDESGMGPHGVRLLPYSDVFYGSGTQGNRHYQDILTFRRVLKGTTPPPVEPPSSASLEDAITNIEGVIRDLENATVNANAVLYYLESLRQ